VWKPVFGGWHSPSALCILTWTRFIFLDKELIMSQSQPGNTWARIVAKAWADESFKKRLIADPKAILKEQGLEVAPGVQLKVIEDTENLHHLTLPPKPAEGELSEEELSMAAGGISLTKWLCFGCQSTQGPTTRNFNCPKSP
jgi:hypothetical protein